MLRFGIRALKQNASQVVAGAGAGDVVIITDRGRPVAQLVPVPGGHVAALIASGRARPAKSSLAALGVPPAPGSEESSPRRRSQPCGVTNGTDGLLPRRL